MNTKKKNKKTRMPKIVLIICLIAILVYVLYQRGYFPVIAMLSTDEEASLELVREIVEVDISENQDFIVNEGQLVWTTDDGVKALSLEGEEIWADTHTFKNTFVKQKSPYFAVGEKGGTTLSVYNDSGKRADIKFANPIMDVSINSQGDTVVVEGTGEGHVVSAYNSQGESLGVKRVTYIEDVGYPTATEISPDGKIVIVSYLNTNDAQISSNLVAMEIRGEDLSDLDNVLYGESYKGTVISEIEFISEGTWVAVGDNTISFNKLDGTEIKTIEDVYFKYAPLLSRLKDWQGVNYAVIASENPIKSTVHPVEKLIIFSQQGEEIQSISLDSEITHMYNDGRNIVVGSDRKFTSYNRMGKKRWEYTATKDIQKMIPLSSNQQVVMISKGMVELMQVVK